MKTLSQPTTEQANKFRHYFGVELADYWDIGFDVIKFDEEFIKAPNGKSTADIIEERYGKQAVNFIFFLLNATIFTED